jgi:hypothetical protein
MPIPDMLVALAIPEGKTIRMRGYFIRSRFLSC